MTFLEKALKNEPYLEKLFEILRSAPGRPVLFEVGANDGYHTRVFQEAMGGKLDHYAFEPDPRNVRLFVDAGLHGVTRFFPAALGDRNGIVPFHLATPEPGGAVGASSLSEFLPSLTASFPWLRCQETVDVVSYRMDCLCNVVLGLPRVDLVWADVQGGERLLFEGMRHCWHAVRHVYTEHDGGYADSAAPEELLAQLNAMAVGDLGSQALNTWEVAMRVPGNVLLKNTGWKP